MIKCENFDLPVPHPGVYIKDEIEELGISQNEFAIRSNLNPKIVSTLINGESNITFDIATKLSSFFGNSVELWLNLQSSFETYMIKKNKKLS